MLNRSTNPHRLIDESKIDQLIILLGENDITYANQKTNTRDSLLHRAAYIGNIQLALEIIYAGGELNCMNVKNETALWIAVCNGHHLLAEILIACGANKDAAEFSARNNKDKNQKSSQKKYWIDNYERALRDLKKIHVKSEIISAILFWQIKHRNKTRPSLFNLIKPQLYNYSLDSEGVSTNVLLIEQLQNTLSQLSHLANKNDHNILRDDLDRVITKKTAMISHEKYLQRSSEEVVENIIDAYTKNNFDDLVRLLKTDNPSRIFSFFLLKNNHALTSFWIIASRCDFYELAPDMIYNSRYIPDVSQNKLLSNLFDFCQGNFGILIYIINDGIKTTSLSISKLGLFKHFWLTDKEATFEQLKKHVAEKHKDPEVLNLEVVTQEKNCYIVNPMNNNENHIFLAYKLLDFGIETSNLNLLDNQQKSSLPTDILALILSFLEKKELEDLSNHTLEPALRRALEKASLSQNPNRDIYLKLQDIKFIINDCFDELDNAYKNGYQSNGKILSPLIFLALLGLLALEIYNFIIYPPIHDAMRADLEKIEIPSPRHYSNCLEFWEADSDKWDYERDVDFCWGYSKKIQNLEATHTLLQIGTTFTSFFLILNSIAIFYYFFHLRAEAPKANFQNQDINEYPKLKSSTARLQNKLNQIKNSHLLIPGSHLIPDIQYKSDQPYPIANLELHKEALENYRDHAIRICNDFYGDHEEVKECKIEVISPNEEIETSTRESELGMPLLDETESKSENYDNYRRSFFR